ncbi:fibronectin type III domain-containing protein [Arsenicibacter rosenii]|uniref:Fibronectin type-III domain-containing protein n=1 Tax=Arsenicibacter rosenii TaxID=1750698 RepID=A0A1S2VG05_9BACT|nr:fibronectin type III domain-containing protein [Arsenicibacter rosenii]OIN57350.1 hypothetical protein BLX24_20455 [Arsenicibacter rosenii]
MKAILPIRHLACFICLLSFFSSIAVSAQTISVSPTSITLAYAQNNGPSVYNFNVSVFGYSGNSVSLSAVCAGNGYTFTSTDGTASLGTSYTASNNSSFFSSFPIVLKLNAGLSVGTYPASITFTSPGAAPVVITVTGLVTADNAGILNLSSSSPSISFTGDPLSYSLTVKASNLKSFTSFNVTLPAGIAASTNGNYYSKTSISISGGAPEMNQKIYFLPVDSYPDPANVIVSGGGGNVLSIPVAPLSLTSTGCANIASGMYPSVANTTSVNLVWTGLTSNGNYVLEWRQQGGAWNAVNGLTGNTYQLTNLTPGNVYEYRVATVCPSGTVSAFGTPVSFTQSGDCPKPIMLEVSNTTLNATTLRWGRGVNWPPYNYNVQWRRQGNSTWEGSVTNVTSTVYSLTGLRGSTAYEFQVDQVCATTLTSGYSTPKAFTTTSCLNTASNAGSFGLTTTTASLSWTSPGSAVIQWRPINGTTWSSTTVSGFTFSLSGLVPNTLYEWQIASACSTTDISGFSTSQTFSTLPSSITVQTSSSQQGCNQLISVTASGGFSPYRYSLSANGQTFNNSTGQFTGLASGVYAVSAIDVNGSTGLGTYTVVSSAPMISFSPASATVCIDQIASLTASGCNSGTVVWATGQTGPVISLTTNTVGTFPYSMSCVSPEGCLGVGTTNVVVVASYPFPQVNVSGRLGDGVNSVSVSAQTTGAPTYTFVTPSGEISTNSTGLFSVSQVGLYTILAINQDGCLLKSSVPVLPADEPLVPDTFEVTDMLTCPEDGQTTTAAGLAAVAHGNEFVFIGPSGYVYSNVYRVPDTYNVVANGISQAGSYTLLVYNQGALTGAYSEGISTTCTSATAAGIGRTKSTVSGASPMRVILSTRPTQSEVISVSVEGVAGSKLLIEGFNAARQLLDKREVGQARSVEQQTLQLIGPKGSYYIKVSTPNTEKTVWLVR